ncbi:hypothetical protein CPB84DRAFT_580985 [Gymnopilus junonius]|uniref:Uncharacterized protein n=1 Tax=Gymnopilus junonius TaxID=109634 RepID=A0A9P5N9S7_GYMJU|nr:hypothetical protein CPB84DRAFT_580985 [Gymnopilus junonius]
MQNIRPPSIIQPSGPSIDIQTIQLPAAAATQIQMISSHAALQPIHQPSAVQTIRPPTIVHTVQSRPADQTISPPAVIQTTQPTDIQAVQPAANVLETQTIQSPRKVPGNEGRYLATHRSSVSRKVLEDVQPPHQVTICNPAPPQPDGPAQNTRSRPNRNVPSKVEPRRILPAPPIATSKQAIRPPDNVSEENEKPSASGQGTSRKNANSEESTEKPKKKARKQQPYLFKISIVTPPANSQTDTSAPPSLPPAPISYQFAFVDGLPRALRPNADGSFRHWDPSQLKES